MNAVLLMGIGNAHRNDDGAGLAVVGALRDRLPEGLAERAVVRLGAPDAAALVEAWGDAALAVIVDAVASGAAPGTVHRLEAGDWDGLGARLPARPQGSTHGLGLGEAIALGRALGRMPRRLVVFGIEGTDFGHGERLSPPVLAALPAATECVLRELDRA